MKNLGPGSVEVSSNSVLVSGSTYTNTWLVAFAAELGNVPEMTIEPGDADLSSIGADVNIATVQVCSVLVTGDRHGCRKTSVPRECVRDVALLFSKSIHCALAF